MCGMCVCWGDLASPATLSTLSIPHHPPHHPSKCTKQSENQLELVSHAVFDCETSKENLNTLPFKITKLNCCKEND